MPSYYYALSLFASGVKPNQLQSEISQAIGVQPQYINNHEGIVEISFATTVSSENQTTISTVISNHVPDINDFANSFTVYPKHPTLSSANYFVVSTFRYRGSNKVGIINKIEVIAYKDTGITSYDIRILDKSTGSVIASKTGNTNENYEILDLGNISNIPPESTLCEVQVKRNGGNSSRYINISEIVVYYGN